VGHTACWWCWAARPSYRGCWKTCARPPGGRHLDPDRLLAHVAEDIVATSPWLLRRAATWGRLWVHYLKALIVAGDPHRRETHHG
jgi:hypothetical protein